MLRRSSAPGTCKARPSLTTDSKFNSQCDPADPQLRGCWLVEDRVATEEEIKFVLGKITDFRFRASYPLQRRMCDNGAAYDPAAPCTGDPVSVPYGYVGGFFDEVRLSKSTI